MRKIDAATTAVTSAQGGVDWHICRSGEALCTSTVAAGFIRAFRSHIADNIQDGSRLLGSFGLGTRHQSVRVDADDGLAAKTMEQLKVLCRDLELPVSGNKQALIERLRDARARGLTTIEMNPHRELMKKWFMRPITTSEMKKGSANEANVCLRPKSFIH